MKTIVLVHGAFASAEAWGYVIPQLENHAHILNINLAGHGADTTTPSSIELSTYVAQVKEAIKAIKGPVILVGHSMAGMVISQVAEDMPEKIEQLVYLAAYLPTSSQSLQELAETDADSLIGPNMEFSTDWSTVTVKAHALPEALAADLPTEVQQYLVQSHKPEPLHPFQGKVTLSQVNYGAVPKVFIKTLADKAVSTALQNRMLAASPYSFQEYTIDSGHLPFLSQPEKLVSILLQIMA